MREEPPPQRYLHRGENPTTEVVETGGFYLYRGVNPYHRGVLIRECPPTYGGCGMVVYPIGVVDS